MFKKQRVYTNALTEKIKNNKNISVEEVFSDELLSVTIRNEAADFLDYIFPKDEIEKDNPKLPKFDLLIKYALENLEYEFEDDNSEKPFTFLISRNAASFLSSPGKKLNEFGSRDGKKRIFRALRKFITTKKANDPMAAGNFTRIFLSWYSRNPEEFEDNKDTKKFYKDDFSINGLISFCVSNIKELSYAELLERFLATDCEADQQNKIRTQILYEILQKIRDIIGEKTMNNELEDESNSISNYRALSIIKDLKKNITNSQPLTWKYEQMPIPSYLGGESETCRSLNARGKAETKDLIPIVKKNIKLSSSEKDLYSYTLINIIWTAATESSTIFEFIQDQQPEGDFAGKKRILEYLLFIGVFGFENVMLCSVAFRILDVVVNGDDKLDIKPISKKNRKDNDNHDIIDSYADFVVFEANNLSNLAVFSFPIFYNHAYPELKAGEDGIVEYRIKNLRSKYLKDKKKHRLTRNHKTNEKGLTPFVYLIPAVMTEPPVSSELCTSYFKILDRLCSTRYTLMDNISKKVIEEEEELKEAIDIIQDIDDIFLDFITYKFEYYGLEGRYNIFELTEKLYPLYPEYYTKTTAKIDELNLSKNQKKIINENTKRARPLINHAFVKITEMICRTDCFLNSDKSGNLISTKDGAPNIPEYKEQDEEGLTIINMNSQDYNKIIEKSIQGRMGAGLRDENQELDGS